MKGQYRHIISTAFLIGVMMVASCDSTVTNDSEAFQAEVLSVLSEDCDLGEVIYDDFAYNTAEKYGSTFPTGSMFGSNMWITGCNTLQHPITPYITSMSKMWYRYNQHQHQLDQNADISFEHGYQWRKLRMILKKNYDPQSATGTHPEIMSGIKLLTGTFAAHVSFSKLEKDARLMQAFWLKSSGQVDEMDFEWANWFGPPNKPMIWGTNHTDAGKHGNSLNLTFYNGISYCPTDAGLFLLDTSHTLSYLSGNAPYLAGSACSAGSIPVEDEWWTLVINHDGSSVSYSVLNEGYAGMPATLWGGAGGEDSFYEPLQHHLNVPSKSMNVRFSVQMPDLQFEPFFNGKLKLQEGSEMKVDWFYYSPQTDLTPFDVQQHVAQLRTTTDPYFRVNTTGFSLEWSE